MGTNRFWCVGFDNRFWHVLTHPLCREKHSEPHLEKEQKKRPGKWVSCFDFELTGSDLRPIPIYPLEEESHINSNTCRITPLSARYPWFLLGFIGFYWVFTAPELIYHILSLTVHITSLSHLNHNSGPLATGDDPQILHLWHQGSSASCRASSWFTWQTQGPGWDVSMDWFKGKFTGNLHI